MIQQNRTGYEKSRQNLLGQQSKSQEMHQRLFLKDCRMECSASYIEMKIARVEMAFAKEMNSVMMEMMIIKTAARTTVQPGLVKRLRCKPSFIQRVQSTCIQIYKSKAH